MNPVAKSGLSVRNLWRDTLASTQFLSRLPVHRIKRADTPIDFSKSAYTFPLAGVAIALPSAVTLYVALTVGLDSLVAAIIAVTVHLFVTGALHEDGLADVADGFWGGATRERKLEIMRDSAIGTYGTLALICSIALRVALLAALMRQMDSLAVVALYLSIASLSRLAILQPWAALPPARPTDSSSSDNKVSSGLSARYGSPTLADFIRALILSVPALVVILFGVGIAPLLLALFLLEATVLIVSHVTLKHVGGHTGDVLGATQQMSEIGLLLGLTIAI